MRAAAPTGQSVDLYLHRSAVDVTDGIGAAVRRFIFKLPVTADDGIEFVVAELSLGLGVAGLGSHDFLHRFDRDRSSLSSRRGSENRGMRLAALFPGEQLKASVNSSARMSINRLKIKDNANRPVADVA
jgi:hypothetical protein